MASFCASETAETGRIANGREQGDHVGGDRAAKDLIGLVQSFCLCVLIRGLQNLEKFQKGFNFVCAKPPLRRAESRFGKPRCSRQGKRFYSFRLYEKNQKYPKGLRPSGLPGTIQSSVEEYYSKVLRRHKPKPVFRTKRWRKGFESVRGSGVTA